MVTFIKIEYLVANSLVELYENKQIKSISLDEIKDYGIKVKEKLQNEENKVIFLYSNDYATAFFNDYSDYFEFTNGFVSIREGITTEQIRTRILSFTPVDVLIAMYSKKALEAIKGLL